MPQFTYPFLADGHLGGIKFGALMTALLTDVLVHNFGEHMWTIVVGVHLVVELMGCRIEQVHVQH